MSNADDLATIARVRRAMPRNADVMRVCDVAEKGITVQRVADAVVLVEGAAKFDKKAYQREYMRNRRQREKR